MYVCMYVCIYIYIEALVFSYSIVVSPDSVDVSGVVCLFCLAFRGGRPGACVYGSLGAHSMPGFLLRG